MTNSKDGGESGAPDPESFLPLSAPVLNILLGLGGGPLHPWGIMHEIERITRGKAVILPGTLYPSIARMLNQGLVEEVPDPHESRTNAERRRYYRLTTLGRRVVSAEIQRLAALIRVAEKHDLDTSRRWRKVAGG